MYINHVGQWAGRLAAGMAAGLVIFMAQAFAEEQGPDELRNQIHKLEQKAQALKADGKMEEAKEVAREAAELREKIVHKEKKRHMDSSCGGERRRDMIMKKLEQSRNELKELREAGNEDKAAEMRKRIQLLEESLEKSGRRPEGERYNAERADRDSAERRIQQVREAADHLREAGLNDIAEKLVWEAERKQREMCGEGDERRGEAVAGRELDQLRAELQELRQVVRQLNARLDGVNRERSEKRER
jgi:hypothetical protein